MSSTVATSIEPGALRTHRLHLPVTTDLEAFHGAASTAERLLVEVGSPGATERGRLAGFICAAIEARLTLAGAAPPTWTEQDDFLARLDDQLYRTRLTGASGIALRFGSLDALADERTGLCLEDSTTLRAWLEAARERPVQLYFPQQASHVRVLDAPHALAGWLPAAAAAWASIEYEPLEPGADEAHHPEPAHLTAPLAPLAPIAAGEQVEEVAVPRAEDAPTQATPTALEAHEPLGALQAVETPEPPEGPEPAETPVPDTLRAVSPASAAESLEPTPSASAPAIVSEAPALGAARTEASVSQPGPSEPTSEPKVSEPTSEPSIGASPAATPEKPTTQATGSEPSSLLEGAAREPASTRAAAAPLDEQKLVVPRPFAARPSSAACLAWLQQLRDMSGPKNHGAIERTFLAAYVPLCNAIASGAAPEGAESVVTRWAEGFAQSYSTAFKRMRSNRPHPRMVWDVIEVAVRWASQYRARGCQLVMIDGLRYDLGLALNHELGQRLGRGARCVEQTLLWSGLPSNSQTQLKLLMQAAGVRAPTPGVVAPRPRPNESSGLERLDLGARHAFKLGGIEEELRRPGEAPLARLERIADTLAGVLAPWLRNHPPGTLVVLFGDHGFNWQATENATSSGQYGGALPEQVLVPASAWVVASPPPGAH